MFGLVSKTDEIPVSLSIRNIQILDVRGLGHLHGKKVMLRVIDKVPRKVFPRFFHTADSLTSIWSQKTFGGTP